MLVASYRTFGPRWLSIGEPDGGIAALVGRGSRRLVHLAEAVPPALDHLDHSRDQKRREDQCGPPEIREKSSWDDVDPDAGEDDRREAGEAEVVDAPRDRALGDDVQVDVELGGIVGEFDLVAVVVDHPRVGESLEVGLLEGGVDALALGGGEFGDGLVLFAGGDLLGEIREGERAVRALAEVDDVPSAVVAQEVVELVLLGGRVLALVGE